MEFNIRADLVPACSPEVEAKLMLCLAKEVKFYSKILLSIEKIDIDTEWLLVYLKMERTPPYVKGPINF